ncbi:hypothetical protein DBR06_SOUSAS19910018, partial [Sousa chinensis]
MAIPLWKITGTLFPLDGESVVRKCMFLEQVGSNIGIAWNSYHPTKEELVLSLLPAPYLRRNPMMHSQDSQLMQDNYFPNVLNVYRFDTNVLLLSKQKTSPGEGRYEFGLLPMVKSMSAFVQHLEEIESHVFLSILISRKHLRVGLGGDTAVLLLSNQITSPGEERSELGLLRMEQVLSALVQHLEETETHVIWDILIFRKLWSDTAVLLLSSQITSPGEGRPEFELLPMEQAMSDLFQHLEETESHVLLGIHISREHL